MGSAPPGPPNPPPDKWYKLKVSTDADERAVSSDTVLGWLNIYPVAGVFVLRCIDGTFVFLGLYKN